MGMGGVQVRGVQEAWAKLVSAKMAAFDPEWPS